MNSHYKTNWNLRWNFLSYTSKNSISNRDEIELEIEKNFVSNIAIAGGQIWKKELSYI